VGRRRSNRKASRTEENPRVGQHLEQPCLDDTHLVLQHEVARGERSFIATDVRVSVGGAALYLAASPHVAQAAAHKIQTPVTDSAQALNRGLNLCRIQ
jgi:hypothetical protein